MAKVAREAVMAALFFFILFILPALAGHITG